MAHLIQSNNCLTAWRDVCRYIIQNGDGFNLLVQIDNPIAYTQVQLTEITNTGVISATEVSDVINTIFPAKYYARNAALPLQQFYDRHEQLYIKGKKIHRKNRSRWGNYFLRFTKFGTYRLNQLQPIIDGINNRTNDQKACYIMHVSSVDYDNNTRIIGNPCLQYVQFGVFNNSLNLAAVYRNHDFLNKGLGNYIGLSKLLEFVCSQTGSNIGSISCQSMHYYLAKKRLVTDCLNKLTW
jgi:thymidylate synthase